MLEIISYPAGAGVRLSNLLQDENVMLAEGVSAAFHTYELVTRTGESPDSGAKIP